MDFLGGLWCNLCIKLCCDVHEVGNGHGIRSYEVEPMLGEWAAYGQPTVLDLDQKCPCVVCMKLFELNGCVV